MAETQFPAALAACESYDARQVQNAVDLVLDACGWVPPRGRVLVKPNLLRASPDCCTHPAVVAALCRRLIDMGAHPVVADSPGFGSARGVARAIGLDDALKPLGLEVQPFDSSAPVRLRSGGVLNAARLALEADAVVSVPRVKAHAQIRLTLAVKNLFGCVCGLGKAMAHARRGLTVESFCDDVADLLRALPPAAALADGVTAMHITGPSGGKPYHLGLIGASASAPAFDCALYAVLGARPEQIPLWEALIRAGIAGAAAEPSFPLKKPEEFNGRGFVMPSETADISFRPLRLAVSIARRLWKGMTS